MQKDASHPPSAVCGDGEGAGGAGSLLPIGRLFGLRSGQGAAGGVRCGMEAAAPEPASRGRGFAGRVARRVSPGNPAGVGVLGRAERTAVWRARDVLVNEAGALMLGLRSDRLPNGTFRPLTALAAPVRTDGSAEARAGDGLP